MQIIFAAVIVVFPLCIMVCFVCDYLVKISRHLDRTASTLFRIEQHMDDERRQR